MYIGLATEQILSNQRPESPFFCDILSSHFLVALDTGPGTTLNTIKVPPRNHQVQRHQDADGC
jgi:hypothetical protein